MSKVTGKEGRANWPKPGKQRSGKVGTAEWNRAITDLSRQVEVQNRLHELVRGKPKRKSPRLIDVPVNAPLPPHFATLLARVGKTVREFEQYGLSAQLEIINRLSTSTGQKFNPDLLLNNKLFALARAKLNMTREEFDQTDDGDLLAMLERRPKAAARSKDPSHERLRARVIEMRGGHMTARDMCERIDHERLYTPPGWGSWEKKFKLSRKTVDSYISKLK